MEIEELFGLPAHPLVAPSLVSGAGATWSIVEVGHSGAEATWDEVGD